MSADDELRNAVAAELAALTAHGGPAGTWSSRATAQQFADDPLRARVRKDIITDYLVDELAPGGGVREAVITAGVPGAGKSTAVNAILGADASQYRRVDADEIKDALLEDAVASNLYADLLGRRLADDKPVAPRELAALVHVESTQISDAVRRHVLTSGEPIIIEGTLTWPGLGNILLTELQDADYTHVRVILVEVPEQIAQERALDRWWRVRRDGGDALGGRFTPPDVIASYYGSDGISVSRANAETLVRDAAGYDLTAELEVWSE
ncbi:zeta toxin family protein [Gordonia sp. p3-SID1431]|uniref:zeta toxin family protein n=1 Tax=Gordonia sp. p3-SID1431 TaxID=2916159 RepID=UPI0021A2CA00|nr:zeta toxin family protein [Gordonia sp. p3-SID1431]MCT1354047.1 zeta toxin family protein [Gordonia sp. p3-SID1431]